MRTESFISVVIPLLPDTECECHEKILEIHKALDKITYNYEIILIKQSIYYNELKSDDSIIDELPSLRILMLSGKNSLEIMYAAGVDNSVGDFVVTMNLETDDASLISNIVEECRTGYDVIVGTSKQRNSYAYNIISRPARFILRKIDCELPKGSTYLRCLSRRAVNSITRTARYHHKFFLRIQKSGYPIREFSYEKLDSRTPVKTFSDAIHDFSKIVVFNSTKPLRWASITGLIGSILSMLFSSYSLLSHFISGDIADGWTTIVLFSSFQFMILFFILIIFGEYISRILDDKSGQDDYSVVYEKNSDIMVSLDRLNVMDSTLNSEINKVQSGRRS